MARPTGVPAQNFEARQFGLPTDTPVPADYDDDGKADIAVYRASSGNWFVLQSSSNSVVVTNFGAAADKPVPNAFVP